MLCCVKAPANAIMQHKQRQLGQNQFWHVLQNWLLCSHPWPKYEWTLYQIKVDWWMLSCTEISFFFFNFEKFWDKPGFPFTQLNQATCTYSKLGEIFFFDMFYKNDCWAVICHPICMNNVSHERGIIVLSFPDISFVILLFVFQRFEIKYGFPFFFNSPCTSFITFYRISNQAIISWLHVIMLYSWVFYIMISCMHESTYM